jgi:hypothetical protein
VVSVTILLGAIAVVGAAFHNGIYYIERAEQIERARVMSEQLIVELETGWLDMKEREQTGTFGDEAMPGMSWRVSINPHPRIQRLLTVDVTIYMGEPDASPEKLDQILNTRVLHVEPRGLDLKEDMGLDDDQVTQLMDSLPAGAGGFVDPSNFDLKMLSGMPLDQLAELLPTLIQAFGVNISNGQMSQVIAALQSGDIAALQGAAQQATGGQLPGSGGAGGSGTGGSSAGSQGGTGRPSTGSRTSAGTGSIGSSGGSTGGGQPRPGGSGTPRQGSGSGSGGGGGK